MRHLNSGRTLNRKPSHRKAMLANLAISILDKERVYTTVPKAKEVRGLVEGLITLGKRGGLHAIRQAARVIHDKSLITKLFGDLADEYKKREGGYTRIVKVGIRKGDAAETAIIELVGRASKIAAAQSNQAAKAAKDSTEGAAEAGSSAASEKKPAAKKAAKKVAEKKESAPKKEKSEKKVKATEKKD